MTTTATETFAPGARVRYIGPSAVGYVQSGQEPTGTVTDDRPSGMNYLPVRLDHPTGGGYHGNGVYALPVRDLAPVVESASDLVTETRDDTALSAALKRAEAAEQALAEFRAKVHEVASREAVARDWCNEIDTVMDEVGLDPVDRGSREMYADLTVTLTVPVRVHRTVDHGEDICDSLDGDEVMEAVYGEISGLRYSSAELAEFNVDECGDD